MSILSPTHSSINTAAAAVVILEGHSKEDRHVLRMGESSWGGGCKQPSGRGQKVGKKAGLGGRENCGKPCAWGLERFGLKNGNFAFQVLYLSLPRFTAKILERVVCIHYFHFYPSLTISILCYFHFYWEPSKFIFILQDPTHCPQTQRSSRSLFLGSSWSREEDPETRKFYPGCLLGAESEKGKDGVELGHEGGSASRWPRKLPSSHEPEAARFPSQSAEE